jgi:hypothetical protein
MINAPLTITAPMQMVPQVKMSIGTGAGQRSQASTARAARSATAKRPSKADLYLRCNPATQQASGMTPTALFMLTDGREAQRLGIRPL